MRSKLVWIFSGASFLLLGALVIRVDRDYILDKKINAEFNSRTQLSAVSHAVSAELNMVAKMMSLSVQQLKVSNTTEYNEDLSYSKFQMLGSLMPPSRAGGDWNFENKYFLTTSETKSWVLPNIILLLRNIKESEVPANSNFVTILQSPQQKKSYIGVISHIANQWFIGVLGSELFLNLIDSQKGEMRSKNLFFVNNLGQVLAHSTTEYVGSVINTDPLVAQIMSENSVNGGGLIERNTGNTYEYFDKAMDSNVYSIASVLESEVFTDRKSNIISLLSLGFAIMSIAGLAIALVYKNEEPSFEIQSSSEKKIAEKKSIKAVASDNQDNMKIFQKIASALSHELSGPINDILGNIQLIKSNLKSSMASISNAEVITENINKVEEQARCAKDITRKLLVFSGEEPGKSIQTQLETPLNKALKMMEGKFLTKGIVLQKQITTTPPIEMDPIMMSRAIEALFVNAIEAMERTSKKELLINLSLDKKFNKINLTLTDSGEGMTEEEMERAFDPFFTTRASTHHAGLGLSMAFGVVKELGGEITLNSNKGKGTTVKLSFPAKFLVKAPEIFSDILPEPSQEIQNEKPEVLESLPALPALSAKLTVLAPEEPTAANMSPQKPRTAPSVEKIVTDDSMEKIIDSFSETDSCETKICETKKASIELRTDEEKVFSGKIDKPNINFKRKTSHLEGLVVPVRKPGFKIEDKA